MSKNLEKLSKPKPPKKPKHGALVKKAHALMREIVILRDKNCVCPPPKNGHSAIMQAGHIIRSVKGGSRFSLFNVHLQCSSCNSRHVYDWHVYEGWFEDRFGSMLWKTVRDESKNPGLKTYELQELIVQLEEILEKQKLNPEFKPYFTQQEVLNGSWKMGSLFLVMIG